MPTIGQLYASAAERQHQLTLGQSGRPFSALIVGSRPLTEYLDVRHAYGVHRIRQPHPYAGSQSWHRVGAEPGRKVLMHVRLDTREPFASSYVAADARSDLPEARINQYNKAKDLYRPLQAGEQEISSSGTAQVFFGRRPVLDLRAGYVRGWYDQDTLEAGARAVTHVRELHLNKVGTVGDEERLGAVTRPSLLSLVQRKTVAAPPGSSMPVNPTINASLLSDDPATIAALVAIPDFEPAKEKTWVLRTGTGTDKVIDHREGHVTDDTGLFMMGKLGGQLRYRKKIYGALLGAAFSGMATGVASAGTGSDTFEEQVDDNGNYYIGLPPTATTGIKIEIPAGKFHVKAGVASAELEFATDGSISMKATRDAILRSELGMKLHSAQVKIGATEAAINKVYATTIKKAAQTTLHSGLSAAQLSDGVLHVVEAALQSATMAVNSAPSICPLTPGVVVTLLAMAHTVIPLVMRGVGTGLKIAKGGFSLAYVGTQDLHESNTVSISS